jgi:hypothetical protein
MLSREAIGSLLQEYPNLALNGDTHEWRISIMGRSLKALPVRILTVRAPSERINLKDFTEQLSGHFD